MVARDLCLAAGSFFAEPHTCTPLGMSSGFSGSAFARVETELGPLFTELASAIRELAAGYADTELTAILEFTVRANQLAAAQIEKVRRLTTERASAPAVSLGKRA
jgi:hypothetical protein